MRLFIPFYSGKHILGIEFEELIFENKIFLVRFANVRSLEISVGPEIAAIHNVIDQHYW